MSFIPNNPIGPGTPDTVAKFTGTGGTVGDSRITDNGTLINSSILAGGMFKIEGTVMVFLVDDLNQLINFFGNTIGVSFDDANKVINFSSADVVSIISLDTPGLARIGHFTGPGNATHVIVDDVAETIALDADNGVDTTVAYKVATVQVVGAQQPAIADSTGILLDLTTQFNTLLAALRVHGLIDT